MKNSQQETTVPVTIIPAQQPKEVTDQETVTKKDVMLKILKENDTIKLSGVFPSQAAVDKALEALRTQTSGKVEKGAIIIDPKADNPNLLASMPSIAKALSGFKNGYFEYNSETITLNGVIANEALKQETLTLLGTIDKNYAVEDQLTVETPIQKAEPAQPQPSKTEETKTIKTEEPKPKETEEDRLQKAQEALNKILRHKRVEFLYAKDQLTAKSKRIIDQVVEVLHKYPSVHIEIAGHTDSDGTAARNLKLSQRRAEAIKRYLIKKGIDAKRLVAKGYGESRPLVKNDTPAHKQINRRVEFKVIK